MIKINNLSFSYSSNPQKALDNISFEISSGEFVVIMGQDAAGKSTLLKTFNGIIPHLIKGKFDGEVLLNNKNTLSSSVSDLSKIAGPVFQDFETQIFSTRVNLEVAFGPENLGLSWDEIDKRIKSCLGITGLKGFENRDPSTLSGGEKQRLCIASILALNPEILCLDEPTTDLDPIGKEEVFNLTKKFFKNKKLTFCLIEHESEEVLSADRIVVIKDGKIKASGPPLDIFKNTELLAQNGIKQPQIIELNRKYNYDIKDFSDMNETYSIFSSKGRINKNKFEELCKNDKEKKRRLGEKVLEVENLHFYYTPERAVLSNINLEIRKGEFVGILGPNGSGKTTLVKHFNGLLKPSRGYVKILGKDTKSQKLISIGQKVGYVFQNPDHQIFSHTVEDEVSFGPKLLGLEDTEIKIRVEESLEVVGLLNFRQHDPFSLTKGQRQRLAVASVLASRPEIIILDEPTTGLDYKEIRNIMNLVSGLNNKGFTIIMVTHSIWVAAEYSNRLIIMKDGKIAKDGTTREVLADEELLKKSSIKLPPLIELSNRLGATLLNKEEFFNCYEHISL